MTKNLPDVSLSDAAPVHGPLSWVGMQGIDLPLRMTEPNFQRDLHAKVDAQVDLPRPETKGIHMSRLYRLLDTLNAEAITPAGVKTLLDQMIETHADCGSTNARLRFSFDLLVRRPALITKGLSGWTSYPVSIEAVVISGRYHLNVEVCVVYSSTCPCSAALSRQVVQDKFLDDFVGQDSVAADVVAAWLRNNASAATPHSQRSEAKVSVGIDETAGTFGLLALIDQIEDAVQTPVQTGVKRADEQAFAVRNGQNLMFVEDAARRIKAALCSELSPRVHVRHIESLHPHDAVAWALPDEATAIAI